MALVEMERSLATGAATPRSSTWAAATGHCSSIMDGCARAAGCGSSVIVIEESRGADTARNLTHAVAAGGRERTAGQLIGLGQACGLSLRGTTRAAGRRAALEFVVSG
jgi:hypothetical protein